MPELPEVETTLWGIQPHILNNEIESINVSQPQLRWPVPSKKIAKALKGNSVFKIHRRAKYLILSSLHVSLLI